VLTYSTRFRRLVSTVLLRSLPMADFLVLLVEPWKILNFSPRSWKARTLAATFSTSAWCSAMADVLLSVWLCLGDHFSIHWEVFWALLDSIDRATAAKARAVRRGEKVGKCLQPRRAPAGGYASLAGDRRSAWMHALLAAAIVPGRDGSETRLQWQMSIRKG
jgi:hypothetical protein